MALERLDGETASFERIQESLQSIPFLADRKLVVLRTPGVNKQFIECAERLFKELPGTTDVLVVEPKPDKRGSYYKLLKKTGDLRGFTEPDEAGMGPWLVATVKAAGGSVSAADARYLVERVGSNQQLLAHELEKLLLYAPSISRNTIELLTDQTPQGSIFELLEAAFSGNTAKALKLYTDQRTQKIDTAQIIAMLTWQLRVLALLKAAAGRSPQDIASAAKLSPFVVRKAQPIASRLSMGRLKQLVADLLAIDARSKRERIDVDEALQNYLLYLAERF
ncbi:MAG: DNA polymerase III subunit delta, partial [Candidatus Micrarchaeaceae archaeon]